MRIAIVILLVLSSCATTIPQEDSTADAMLYVGTCWRVANAEATVALAPTIRELNKAHPLPYVMEIIVIDAKVAGWYIPNTNEKVRRIFIVNFGAKENKNTLRHEWVHALQEAESRPFSDEEARKAETE